MSKQKTDVIFRQWPDGDVIAIFPGVPGTPDPGSCLSYERIGQHGSADLKAVIRRTRPATGPAAVGLCRELRSIGYDLDIVRRATRRHRRQREEQLRRR